MSLASTACQVFFRHDLYCFVFMNVPSHSARQKFLSILCLLTLLLTSVPAVDIDIQPVLYHNIFAPGYPWLR